MNIFRIFMPKPKPAPAPVLLPEPVVGVDPDEGNQCWCITDEAVEELTGLCGRPGVPGSMIPYDEVPEELTCRDCLAIDRYLERKREAME